MSTGPFRFRIGLAALVVVVALGAGTLVIGAGTLKQWINTDLGKSEKDQAAEYEQGRQAFQKKYEAWLVDFVVQGRDPRTLQRVEMLVAAREPQPDLSSAVATASVVVVARVEDVEFQPNATSVVTLAVMQVAKGDPAGVIRIRQPGGPMPDAQWGEGMLAFAESDPLLMSGDVAVLFLDGPRADGIFVVQSFTGSYVIEGGKLKALDGNPFADQVVSLSPDAFLAVVEGLAGR